MTGNNDLTFTIGLDNSDFDKGLKETQKKLSAAMAQFEQEKSLIKIRADIDIAGLDETADKAKILDIQEKALTDTLDIQRQKLQAAANAYELVAESQGVQAAASKKIELAMEKERLKVVQLEKDLEKLKQSATGIDTTVKVNVDDSEIDNIKIDAPKVDIKADVDTSQIEKGLSKAETSIKASVDKLSRQQALIQLRGQVQLEGLDEAAGSAEKLKLQEEALTAQIALQQEKISLLSNAYENLARSQGENSDAAQIAAINLEKERLAMERLQQQTQDLSKQTEIAIGVEWELLGLIEPAIKGIDALIAAGHTIPIPHAKAAAAAAVALSAIVVGTKEATEELRENNPAQILSDSFEDLDFGEVETDISDAFAEISDSATQTSQEIETAFEESAEKVSEEMESFSGSYADYLDDALSIIQILTAETENLGDSLGVVNSQLPYMKTETGRIAAIALGVYKTFDEMTKAVIDFSQTAVDGFKEVRKQANELYLSLSKAQEIAGLIDLAGGDYDDVRDYVRGVQDAVLKGAAYDPEVLAMEKYGVVIQDTKGKLLEFDAALENLYQGYLKAKEAGEAEAYIIMTNGQSIHDVAGFLENYGKAKERAAQIKWSTSDFESLNELTTNLKMAEVQTNEFNNALSTLGVPLVNLAAESNFEFFKQATELIEENRDTILLWEFAAIEAFKSGKEAVIEFADSAIKELKDFNEFFGVTDKVQSLIVGIGESVGLTAEFEETLTASDSDKDSIFDRAKKDLDAYNAANEKSREETKKSRSEAEGLSYSLNRIAKFKEEIADIRIELKFGDDNYKKSLAQLEQWRETALKDARRYEEEQKVIAEEYALKRELIEKQHAAEVERIEKEKQERLAEIRRGVNSQFQTDLQNRLDDIEQEKKSWIEAGMETAEAEILAQKLKVKTITDLNAEFATAMDSIWQTSLEKRLEDIEREKQAWIDKGIAEVEAEQLAQQQKAQLYQQEYESALQAEQNAAQNVESAENALNDALEQREELRQRIAEKQAQEITQAEKGLQVLKSQLEAFRAYRDSGEKGLQEYYLKQLRKQGITDNDLKMTPAQLEGFQKAARDVQKSLMPNLEQTAPPDPEMLKQLGKLDDRIAKLQGELEKAREALKEAREKRQEAEKAYKNSTSTTTPKDNTPPKPLLAKNNPDGSTTLYTPSHGIAHEELDKLKRETNKLLYGEEKPNVALEITPTGSRFIKALDEAGNTTENFKKKLDDATPTETPDLPKTELPATAADIPTPTPDFDFSDIAAKFEILPPIIENISSGLDDLTPKITDTSAAFDDFQSSLENATFPMEITEAIHNLSSSITAAFQNIKTENQPQIELPDYTSELAGLTNQAAEIIAAIQTGTSSVEKAIVDQRQNTLPPNVTNNISIQEAHAWDYEHINELAEKVADVITPQILSAIGGNSNVY